MDTTWFSENTANEAIFHSSFVGREKELSKLARWIDSDYRVLFITGQGGIGKTALIREFERIQGDRFEGGIYNVSAHNGIENINEILNKYAFGSSLSLVVIDDIEFLREEEINSLIGWANKTQETKVICSGRTLPNIRDITKYLNTH